MRSFHPAVRTDQTVNQRETRRLGASLIRASRLSVRAAILVLLPSLWASLAAAQTAGTGTIAGTVVDLSGTGVSGLAVSLVESGASTTTGPEGRFTITGVQPGAYTLRLSDGRREADQGGIAIQAGQSTRLQIEFDSEVFAIRTRSAVGSEGQRALPLPGLTVHTSRSAEGYVERHSDVGLGFPAAISRVPQSIHVVPRRMIEQQRPVTLSDVVRNVAGVSAARNSVEPFRSFKLRGFTVGESVIDGIRNTGSLNIQAEGMANIERVEVLRGPGGAVFGQGSPGGTVNIVTKKPLDEARLSARIGVGDFGYIQPEVDVTGPLGAGLGYRVVATWERRESFIDFVEPEAAQVAPTLEWSNDSGVTLRYQGDWRRRELLRYINHPFSGTVVDTDQFELPRSLFTGEPDQGETVSEGFMNTFTLEQRKGSSRLLRGYVRINRSEYDQPSVAPAALEDDGRTLNRRFNRFEEEQDEWVVGAQFVQRFEVGRLPTTFSAGFDVADWTYLSLFERGSVAPIDVVDPEYGAQVEDVFTLADSEDQFQQLGGYAQALLTPADVLTVLVGLRWDQLENRTRSNRSDTEGSRTDVQFSPRAGVSWEVVPGVSPYGSFATTFAAGPNFGFVRTPDGNPLGPEVGRQYEFGLKVDIGFDLVSTIAVFDLEKENVATADPQDPAFRVPTGRQRARGLEAFVAWEPSPVSLFGSYAYTDAEVTEDTDIPVGSRLDNVPEHSWRVWAASERPLPGGWTGGLKLGVHGNSAVVPVIGGQQEIPGFTIWEGGVFVRRGPFLADLMIPNLTDDYYFLRGAFGGTGVIPGDARRIILTLGWQP